jgi:hypothetical protein
MVINNRDLNKACTNRWKNLKWSSPAEKAIAMKPR